MSTARMLHLGVVGDLHQQWDRVDVRTLDAQGYDYLLFVGDLGSYRVTDAERVARRIAPLTTPAFVIAGNHDAVHVTQLVAEAIPRARPIRGLLGLAQPSRVDALASTLAPAILTGYAAHPLDDDPDDPLYLIAARPHSMGGPELAFAHVLSRRYGVASLDASIARLREIVDETPPGCRLVFLAHNGATGLGSTRRDLAGRDFHRDEGDWGDPDLAAAVAYARASGRRPLLVVSGHMHLTLRGGGRRVSEVRAHGTLHVNAAEVPRHRRDRRGEVVARHHVRVTISGEEVRVKTLWLDATGRTASPEGLAHVADGP